MLELTGREAEQRVRRAQRGAERDELLAALEELEWWYRDLVVLAAGAEGTIVHVDRLDELRSDATRERLQAAERACELIRTSWREAEELQLSVPLALEALLVRLRRELAGPQVFARLGPLSLLKPLYRAAGRTDQRGVRHMKLKGFLLLAAVAAVTAALLPLRAARPTSRASSSRSSTGRCSSPRPPGSSGLQAATPPSARGSFSPADTQRSSAVRPRLASAASSFAASARRFSSRAIVICSHCTRGACSPTRRRRRPQRRQRPAPLSPHRSRSRTASWTSRVRPKSGKSPGTRSQSRRRSPRSPRARSR